MKPIICVQGAAVVEPRKKNKLNNNKKINDNNKTEEVKSYEEEDKIMKVFSDEWKQQEQ